MQNYANRLRLVYLFHNQVYVFLIFLSLNQFKMLLTVEKKQPMCFIRTFVV